jgi:hypothetical protein
LIEECGLPSTQVWAAVIEDLVASGAVSRANVDAWLRSTRLLGRLDDGSLVVGAAHALALRRIESRFSGELRASAAKIIGRRNALHFVVTREWLAGSVDLAISEPEPEFGAA